jgi:hypothetical protein
LGDVINAYNDGPNDDGTQLGRFLELETSSPAAALKSGNSITHTPNYPPSRPGGIAGENPSAHPRC